MTKRCNGQGAVYLRGDGRWEGQIRLGDGGGNRCTGRVGARSSGGSAKRAG
jgi:hypothetical protein